MDEENLTTFIEKSFKNNNNERLTYSEMKQNSFYGFMVQSAIDLLSDKLISAGGKENKYDKDGNIDENGRTLDDWISESGGIDNIYGGGTRNIVKIVQHILKIHEDGFAGPQFFAKICSVLDGNQNVGDFKVKGYDDRKKYRYGFEQVEEKADKTDKQNDNEEDDNKNNAKNSTEEVSQNPESGNNNPIDNNLFNILSNQIIKGLPEWARITQMNTNPYITIMLGKRDNNSGTGQYTSTFGSEKINIHDYIKSDNSGIDINRLISFLENKYNLGKENYEKKFSKNQLKWEIIHQPSYDWDSLGLSDQKDNLSYNAFFSYFGDKGAKIDNRRTQPVYKDGYLIFDFNPRGLGNCPEYFRGIKIAEEDLIDENNRYSTEKFKEQLAIKIKEIVETNFHLS